MKVQKRFLRKYKNKDYYKYVINIPPMMVKESGLQGYELDAELSNGEIRIKKKKQQKQHNAK
jgi:antitoxin component of MazEF toxin-antitoxin module